MKRFDCLGTVAVAATDALVVTSAGAVTLEWNAYDPATVIFGAHWGFAPPSLLDGVGLPHRKVIALDGDGSLLMNLCSLPTLARMQPKNLVHIVFDNGVYEASGSKKTATAAGTDLVGMARAAGSQALMGAFRR